MITRLSLHYTVPDTDVIYFFFFFLKLKKKKQRYASTYDSSTYVFKQLNQIARSK